ncbi:TMEM38B [Cordylochernes scorpioides]|uniref:TMEM38B n=1 Tax=Cordylochernes scorpioides TaxID=51811 RepID=A0ABY6KCZ4_9ARAC|nr:TMEM38B [Cordylochernes scorpioides]
MACWASCMVSMFAGSILANFLLGEPVLTPFKNNYNILMATAVWYAIFYAPFDAAYTVCRFLPVRLVLAAAKEVLRCKKVHDGVSHAVRVYPNGYLIMIIIGAVKDLVVGTGTGSDFMRIFERLVRGTWTPNAMALLHPSFSTKACIAASVLFVLEKKTDFFTAPHALVYSGAVVIFVHFKLSAMLLGMTDPFQPFENLFCFFFLGGIWDAIARASECQGECRSQCCSRWTFHFLLLC